MKTIKKIASSRALYIVLACILSVILWLYVASYANIVKDKAILRRIISTTQEIENNCYLGKDDGKNRLEGHDTDQGQGIKYQGISQLAGQG